MNFLDAVNRINSKSPFQKKRLMRFLGECDDVFFQEADDFTIRYEAFLKGQGIAMEYAVDAYLNMCRQMQQCQLKFKRTGRYPASSPVEAIGSVYLDQKEMLAYMVGLGLSQFLWPTHYQIFTFFKEAIVQNNRHILRYLEIGPGHGLFLEKALSLTENLQMALAVDISPTSLNLSRAFINYSRPGESRLEFRLGDITQMRFTDSYDFITLGEVLEHVEQPDIILSSLRSRLTPAGKLFISTCANCPAIDHVYQFDDVRSIRDMIVQNGFIIEKELPLPTESVTLEQAEKDKITINYCAILRAA